MPSDKVKIEVRANRPVGDYKPIWNWFGYDEPNYTYTANGRKLLGELAALSPAPVRVRAHNLLTSGDGTPALKWGSTNAYTEDASGNPVYDWTIMDKIFDAYVEAGNTPFIQVGFTPRALSDSKGPYQHGFSPADQTSIITTGWAHPPNDLRKWSGLIAAWAGHLADRYGHERVATWPWELWNEPDGHYWTGTIPEFCALYDVTVVAIKGVLPQARVGGPHTCGPFARETAATFLREFLKHCVLGRNAVTGETGSPLDFVAFHAKGAPLVHEGHVRMGISTHLRHIAANLAIMKEFPELHGLPAILGESDPEGCAACSARYTPRNGYRNGPLYGVYVIESIIRTYELSRRYGIEIEGAVTWAFLFEDQPYFDGFRDLATNGIDKAVLNAFRMLGMLGGQWVEARSNQARPLDEVMEHGVRKAPDVNAVATRDEQGLSILVWHYHDDDEAGEGADIALSIEGWPRAIASLRHYRMDADHSNAFAVWKGMGSPAVVEGEDYRRLEASGKLAQLHPARPVEIQEGAIRLQFALPRQGVSLIRLE
jgi:xylan 1,4-beta-xylosidase